MIFSYGFLESDRTEAKQVILEIEMPDDDPLAIAKKMICQEAPGIRISTIEDSDKITWESPLIWWATVNEEDGLQISLAQTTDGERELEATWKGEKIRSSHHLQDVLAAEPLWDIFQLRAVILVLQRLETQLSLLHETAEILLNMSENPALSTDMFRPEVFSSISRLRIFEAVLLERAVEQLMTQVSYWG